MKKRILLLLALSFVMQPSFAKQSKNLSKKIDLVEHAALNRELKRAKAARCCGGSVSSCFDTPDSICCKRGKRGKRGPRGHAGVGAVGLGEIFINSLMMAWYSEGTFLPFDGIFIPYANGTPTGTSVVTWALFPSTELSGTPPVGANFNVPIDLDVTKPVTAIIHVLVDSSVETGNQAALQVQADYQANNGLLGSVAPATGFADTENSADFTVISAIPSLSTNAEHMSISVPLNTTKMVAGDWAFITVGRIAPAANEYSGNLYLSTISIQYTRLTS